MPAELDNLKHIVILMMNGRSFDHMLGGLRQKYPNIAGLTGNESNPDTNGTTFLVQPLADFQGQLVPSPDNHFPGVDLQILAEHLLVQRALLTCRVSSRAITRAERISSRLAKPCTTSPGQTPSAHDARYGVCRF